MHCGIIVIYCDTRGFPMPWWEFFLLGMQTMVDWKKSCTGQDVQKHCNWWCKLPTNWCSIWAINSIWLVHRNGKARPKPKVQWQGPPFFCVFRVLDCLDFFFAVNLFRSCLAQSCDVMGLFQCYCPAVGYCRSKTFQAAASLGLSASKASGHSDSKWHPDTFCHCDSLCACSFKRAGHRCLLHGSCAKTAPLWGAVTGRKCFARTLTMSAKWLASCFVPSDAIGFPRYFRWVQRLFFRKSSWNRRCQHTTRLARRSAAHDMPRHDMPRHNMPRHDTKPLLNFTLTAFWLKHRNMDCNQTFVGGLVCCRTVLVWLLNFIYIHIEDLNLESVNLLWTLNAKPRQKHLRCCSLLNLSLRLCEVLDSGTACNGPTCLVFSLSFVCVNCKLYVVSIFLQILFQSGGVRKAPEVHCDLLRRQMDATVSDRARVTMAL